MNQFLKEFSLIANNKIILLKKIIDHFHKLNLYPCIGLELEFYLTNGTIDNSILLVTLIRDFFLKKELPFVIVKEHGKNQFEIKTAPYKNILILCSDFILVKNYIQFLSKKHFLNISFFAQYYKDDCGSALQVNFNFLNKKNVNLFRDVDNNLIFYSISSLLELSKYIILFLISKKEELIRFDYNLNIDLFKKGKFTAPCNFSWGYNNRTTAIRIPSIGERRIEYRIPSSSSDIYLVLLSFFIMISYGLKSKSFPSKEIHGNAFDKNYDLEKINTNYQHNKRLFIERNIIYNFFLINKL